MCGLTRWAGGGYGKSSGRGEASYLPTVVAACGHATGRGIATGTSGARIDLTPVIIDRPVSKPARLKLSSRIATG